MSEDRSAEAFGAALARLRSLSGLSYRELELAQDRRPIPSGLRLSKSQLNRFENGRSLPKLIYSDLLDELYEGRGEIKMLLHNLRRPTWDPVAEVEAMPDIYHAIAWPWHYSGLVWIRVMPTVHDVDSEHIVELRWGAWVAVRPMILTSSGVTFVTGKAIDEDEIAVTLNVSADRPVFVLHGTGSDVLAGTVIDLRQGWGR